MYEGTLENSGFSNKEYFFKITLGSNVDFKSRVQLIQNPILKIGPVIETQKYFHVLFK